MTAYRVDHRGAVDRAAKIHFTFDGHRFTGLAGDTLASALLANGVGLMGRSFKYHRPRGVLSAGSEEPNALVTISRGPGRQTPNLRATEVELHDGLEAFSQNAWPSLGFDVGCANDWLGRFLPAGFYYKTFMWPLWGWRKIYEPLIRKAAGLGRAPDSPDPDHYASRYAHCEVLVVGGGPAGLAAALAAAKSGLRVMLCEEQSRLGGSLLQDPEALIEGQRAADWVAQSAAELTRLDNVTVLTRCQTFGYFAHNMLGLVERLTDHRPAASVAGARERLWQVRAKTVVLATGAHERPMVFTNNDRPGVLLSSAARTYLEVYGVAVGRKVVLVTATDRAYADAAALKNAGVTIAAIVDVRPGSHGPDNGLTDQWLRGHAVVKVLGRNRVSALQCAPMLADGRLGALKTIPCDAVLMAGGMTPSVHLFSQSRGKLVWSEGHKAFLPGAPAEAVISAGACRGLGALAAAIEDGARAGAAAADGRVAEAPLADAAGWPCGELPKPALIGGKAFVDWQNDVTAKDIGLAVREGFQSIEHVKRYTTTGMATDQGKTSNINALALAAAATGKPIPKVGLTTFRMPYTPVTFGALAGVARGPLFDPERTTPIHDWAQSQGAVFEDVSLWKRARYFPIGGETMDQAVARECLAVRSGCGIFDASTLGKIEVCGPDAAEFLNRMYVNAWTNLAPGRCRYGVLLREDGFILDDGVIARLSPDLFHVTTTTGGAARVLAMMEDYLQTEWPDLRVWLTSVTEQWGVIALQGPRARQILARLVEGVDLDTKAFPHMSVVQARVADVPTRLMRVSFTGELGFEINVPASAALDVWNALWKAGEGHGLTPYGTETMHVLRAEKGYIIVGQETDGTVTPDDVGLGWAVGKAKPDFVGKRSLARASMADPVRKQLVGLSSVDGRQLVSEGAQIVERPGETAPRKMIGHVTSAYESAVLQRPIALALISGGRQRIGQTLYASGEHGDVPVTVCSPVFVDTEGKRLHA